MQWYLAVLKNYVGFSGRARRKEYWTFTVISVLIMVVLMIIDKAAGTGFLTGIYGLAVLIPSLAVTVRRLHDTGRSGWWVLIGLIPFVGGLILLVFTFLEGQPNANDYGPNPKAVAAA
jgi:uncharacterized membrane protein YhaH (DUF805 family)